MIVFGDILVIGILAAVVGLIIGKMIRERKKGGGCCGCSGCATGSCQGCSGRK